MAFGAAVLLGWTLLGGIDALNAALRDFVQPRGHSVADEISKLVDLKNNGSITDEEFERMKAHVISQTAAN